MKIQYFIALLLLNVTSYSYGQGLRDSVDTYGKNIDASFADQAKLVVANFITLLFKKGNIDSLLSKCSVPFVVDGKEVSNSSDLKKIFIRVMDAVNKRGHDINVDTTYIFGSRKEILNELIAVDVYFVACTIKIGVNCQSPTQQSIFSVQVGDRPKIIGIANQ